MENRPILKFTPSLVIPTEEIVDSMLKAMMYSMEKFCALSDTCSDGRIIMILESTHITWRHFNLHLVKESLHILQNMYPERLFHV